MKGLNTNSSRSKLYHRKGGRQPQLNITFSRRDVELFDELLDVLEKNHLLSVSRSYGAKFSIALALHVVRQAEAKGTYGEVAALVAGLMKQPA